MAAPESQQSAEPQASVTEAVERGNAKPDAPTREPDEKTLDELKYELERKKYRASLVQFAITTLISVGIGIGVTLSLKALDREKAESELQPRIDGAFNLQHYEQCDSPADRPQVEVTANLAIKNVGWRPLSVGCVVLDFRLLEQRPLAEQADGAFQAFAPIPLRMRNELSITRDAGARIQAIDDRGSTEAHFRMWPLECTSAPTEQYSHDETFRTTASWRIQVNRAMRNTHVVHVEALVVWCQKVNDQLRCTDQRQGSDPPSFTSWSFSNTLTLAHQNNDTSNGWCSSADRPDASAPHTDAALPQLLDGGTRDARH